MESDGTAIETELTKLNLKNQIVKAQMIYLTYFENVQKGENFFADFCGCFKESDNEKLIDLLNRKYGLSISYEEFMRSYAVITNVSIDENRFLNLEIMNNIDLARWAENAYETQWGYVPHTDGNVLSAEKYKALKEKYPDEITTDCDKWQSRRTVDNYNLLCGHICGTTRKTGQFQRRVTAKLCRNCINLRLSKGDIDSLPETVGTAVISGDTIGIYVGDGNVVYAKICFADGVMKEPVSTGSWTAWFEIPWIEYGEENKLQQ